MYNETLGKIHFYLMLPAFYVQSLGQMYVGLLGMRRRIADYDPALGLETTHLLISIAGYVIGLAMVIFVINLFVSVRRGEMAEANPWKSRSLEFQLPSPIPAHNYSEPVEVVGEPYDYGLPDAIYTRPLPTSGEPAAAD